MKKIAQTVGMIVVYLALYWLMQTLVSVAYGAGYGVFKAFESGFDNMEEFQDIVVKGVLAHTGYILIIAAVLTLLIFWLIERKKRIVSWNLRPIHWRIVALLILLGISSGLTMSFILSLVSQLQEFKSVFDTYEEFTSELLGGNVVLLLVSVGIIIPIFEEILFRGMIMDRLRRIFHVRTALIIQAVLFGLYHLNIVQSIYATVLGLLLGLVCLKFNSVIASSAVHIGINSLAVFATLDRVNSVMETYGLLFLVGAFILCAVLLTWLFKRPSIVNQTAPLNEPPN